MGCHVRALALVTAVLCTGLAAPSAHAQRSGEAREHFDQGTQHFDAGRYDQAAVEFEQAHRITHHPDLLYNVYIAHDRAGHPREAATALRRYLDLRPDAEGAGSLRTRLEELEAELAPTPTDSDPASATDSDPASASDPASDPDPASATDPATDPDPDPASEPGSAPRSHTTSTPLLPITLLAGGGALLAGGALTGALALAARGDLTDACREDGDVYRCAPGTYEDAKSRGETMALLTDLLLLGGVAAVAVGATLWLTADDGEAPATAGAACTEDGCLGAVRVGF